MSILSTNILTKQKSKIILIAKLIFSIIIIWYVVEKVDFRLIRKSFLGADKILISVSFALMLVNLAVQFYKWEIISDFLVGESSKFILLKSLFLGIASAMITPLQTGVYIGRASVFDKDKIPKVILATFYDKISMLILTAFLGSFISVYFITEKLSVSNFITIPLLILSVLLGLFFFSVLASDKIKNSEIIRVFLPNKIFEKYKSKIEFSDKISPQLFWKTFPLFFIQKFILLTQFVMLIFAFGGRGNLFELYLSALLVFFSKSFFPPVTVGDIGVREAMSVFFFGLVGVSSEVALSAAVFLFVINLLFPSVVALIFIARK